MFEWGKVKDCSSIKPTKSPTKGWPRNNNNVIFIFYHYNYEVCYSPTFYLSFLMHKTWRLALGTRILFTDIYQYSYKKGIFTKIIQHNVFWPTHLKWDFILYWNLNINSPFHFLVCCLQSRAKYHIFNFAKVSIMYLNLFPSYCCNL